MSSDDADATMYYPSDMLHDYKNIGTRFGTISVNKYRNNRNPIEKGGTQEAVKIKDALLQLDSHAILARAGGAASYVDVFTGKGSVESIQRVMDIFFDYSDRFVAKYGKMRGTVRQCADWLADENLSWLDTFRTICDAYIGLDCNGFTGNWIKRADHALRLGPQNGPMEFYNRRKLTRKSVDSIEYADIIVWVDNTHIATIDTPCETGDGKFNVCQSAGGGPRTNEYRIVVSSPGKFRLQGGIPKWDHAGEVYIISPWPGA